MERQKQNPPAKVQAWQQLLSMSLNHQSIGVRDYLLLQYCIFICFPPNIIRCFYLTLRLNCIIGPSFSACHRSSNRNSRLRQSSAPASTFPTTLPGANLISYSQTVLAIALLSSMYARFLPMQPLGPKLNGKNPLYANSTLSTVTSGFEPTIHRSGL